MIGRTPPRAPTAKTLRRNPVVPFRYKDGPSLDVSGEWTMSRRRAVTETCGSGAGCGAGSARDPSDGR